MGSLEFRDDLRKHHVYVHHNDQDHKVLAYSLLSRCQLTTDDLNFVDNCHFEEPEFNKWKKETMVVS